MKSIKNLLFILLLYTATGCISKSSPEYVAKQYLLALKNRDWETANKYSTKDNKFKIKMHQQIANGDWGIIEIESLKCETFGDRAKCSFCCSKDTSFSYLLLERNTDNGWLIRFTKEHPRVE